MTTTKSLITKVEKGSGNVYADLGMDNAEEMLVKVQLASKISEIIKQKKLSQQQASEILGIPPPKLSKMLRGQFRGISEMKMMLCLIKLGRKVDIVVTPIRGQKAASHPNVVFA